MNRFTRTLCLITAMLTALPAGMALAADNDALFEQAAAALLSPREAALQTGADSGLNLLTMAMRARQTTHPRTGRNKICHRAAHRIQRGIGSRIRCLVANICFLCRVYRI